MLGHACLVIGAAGLFLPLLPTTPFVLLAAFFYSKGSKRLHRWLVSHPRFGRAIRDWQRHGVIRTRAKWISTLLIIASLSYPVLFQDLPVAAKVGAVLVVLGVLVFIHTRPSQPRRVGRAAKQDAGGGKHDDRRRDEHCHVA